MLDKSPKPTNQERGYGIVILEFKQLKFGIALRSHIQHRYAFIAKREEGKAKGLDFTKAVLIETDSYFAGSFYIPDDEFRKISDKEYYIKSEFNKYVEQYIKAVREQNQSLLDRAYRYSTLQNYHTQLEI